MNSEEQVRECRTELRALARSSEFSATDQASALRLLHHGLEVVLRTDEAHFLCRFAKQVHAILLESELLDATYAVELLRSAEERLSHRLTCDGWCRVSDCYRVFGAEKDSLRCFRRATRYGPELNHLITYYYRRSGERELALAIRYAMVELPMEPRQWSAAEWCKAVRAVHELPGGGAAWTLWRGAIKRLTDADALLELAKFGIEIDRGAAACASIAERLIAESLSLAEALAQRSDQCRRVRAMRAEAARHLLAKHPNLLERGPGGYPYVDAGSALLANAERQHAGYDPHRIYVDRRFTCKDCGAECVFRADEQLAWYEQYGFYAWSFPEHCQSCRVEARTKKFRRAQYDRQAARDDAKLTPGQAAALADLMLELFGPHLSSKLQNRYNRLRRKARRTESGQGETTAVDRSTQTKKPNPDPND